MGTLVTYRDLPGGPTKIKFTDEISRHCLCRKCQMLSLCMYTDTASHMFCDNCLNDQSYKYKKYEIYCPDERKEVSLAEMFEARDLVTILRDQYVECPNQPKCTVKLPLWQLENHYIKCKEISSIKCTKCGQEIPSTLWITHKANCQVTCDNEFKLKESDNRGAKRKPPPVSSASLPFCTSRKNKSTRSTTAAESRLSPSSQRADATTGEFNQQFEQMGHASSSTQLSVEPKYPTSDEPDKTTCKHCGRKVKETNMPRHLDVCYEFPVTCPYCEKEFSRNDIKAHVEQCERQFEEARKTSDAAAAGPEKFNNSETSHQRKQNGVHQPTLQPSRSYAEAVKLGKGTENNATTFKRGAPSPERQERKRFNLHRKQDKPARNTQAGKLSGSKQIATKSSFHGLKGRASPQHCNNSREGTPVAPGSRQEGYPRYMTRSQTKKLRDEEKAHLR